MFSKISETIRIKMFMTESFIIDWSNYDKSIFILLLGGLNALGNLIWYVLAFSFPETRQWLSESYFFYYFPTLIIFFFVYLIAIILSYLYRKNRAFQSFIPYFSPMFFGLTTIYTGYTIGIYNPVTIAGYVSMVLVGLVLYDRKIVYYVVVPVTLFIILACYLTTIYQLPYAPLFSEKLNLSIFYHNTFWVISMIVLYLPIMLVSILLFELLLWQWRKREEKYEEFSKTDSLTGVYNRRFVDLTLKNLELTHENYALALLDLDHFKSINDRYGHCIGDRVLKRVTEVLSLNIRQNDIVGRYGGEEFILILRQKTLDQAVDIAERCRKQLEQEMIRVNTTEFIRISASFGVAISGSNLFEKAINHADQALYRAKASGRNQVQRY